MKFSANVFRAALLKLFDDGERAGKPSLTIRAGDLYTATGARPSDKQMPTCCSVMTQAARFKAQILAASPKSKSGANLIITYRLPRR